MCVDLTGQILCSSKEGYDYFILSLIGKVTK
jgi:hypothetical protein